MTFRSIISGHGTETGFRVVATDFIMNRKSATKWHEFDPDQQKSAPIQLEMVGELRRAKPNFIVIEAIWVGWREPNDRQFSSGVTILDDHIQSAFEPVAAFGVNTVMRPRSSERSFR